MNIDVGYAITVEPRFTVTLVYSHLVITVIICITVKNRVFNPVTSLFRSLCPSPEGGLNSDVQLYISI